MSPEEKEIRKLERKERNRQKKWNEQHKIINDIDHKFCPMCKEWLPANNEYFYKKNNYDGLDSYCKVCTNKRTRKWEQENKERVAARVRGYNKTKEWRKRQLREWSEKRRKDGTRKEWEDQNRDKLKQYRLNRQHKEHNISEKEWNSCKEYFDNECAYCGIHISEHFNKFKGKLIHTDFHKEHVDHEGASDLSNCIPSCKSCNSQKWARSIDEWYNESNTNYTKERFEKIIKWLTEDYLKYIIASD